MFQRQCTQRGIFGLIDDGRQCLGIQTADHVAEYRINSGGILRHGGQQEFDGTMPHRIILFLRDQRDHFFPLGNALDRCQPHVTFRVALGHQFNDVQIVAVIHIQMLKSLDADLGFGALPLGLEQILEHDD